MAALLQFEPRLKANMPDLAKGHTAKILMFTGVRFERIDFAALKHSETTKEQSNANERTRIAN
jgi:hypothetical protein